MLSAKEENAKKQILENAVLIKKQIKQSIYRDKIQRLKKNGKTITPELKSKIVAEIEEFSRDFL